MALIVADLVAKLGIDAKAMDAQVDAQTKKTAKDLSRIVVAASDVGREAGDELAEGLGRGGDEGVVSATKALKDGEGRMAAAGGQIGDSTGEELVMHMRSSTVDLGDDLEDRLRSNASGLDERARQVGRDAGAGVETGLDAGSTGVGAGLGDQFKSNTSDLPAKARERGKDTGDGIGGGIIDGMPDLSGGIGGLLDDALGSLPAGLGGPATAAGAAIGTLIMGGLADAIESDAGADKLAAGLGVGVDTAERDRLAGASADLYRDAWGESTADVRTAIDAVYSTLEESRESEAALERLTTKGMAIADVFGTDVAMAASNAGILIKTGLAKNADEAFDLIAKSATEVPAHIRDELGDATQEYSTYFGQLGFDGQEAFGMLVDAADDGTYALDKTGDAIKELFVRAGNVNDKAAMDALTALGFEAEDVAAKLKAGGPAAREMTAEIAAALRDNADPVLAHSIAIDLMGGTYEDLGQRQGEFIDQLADGGPVLKNVAGAADDLADSYDNTASSVTVLKRELTGLFEDFANRKLDPLAWLVSDDDKSLGEWASNVGSTLGGGIMDAIKLQFFGPAGLFGIDFPNPFGGGGEDDTTTGQGVGAAIAGEQAAAADRAAVSWRSLNDQIFGWTKGTADATVSAEQFTGQIDDLGDRVKPIGDDLAQAAVGAESFRNALSGDNELGTMLSTALDVSDVFRSIGDELDDLGRVDISDVAEGVEYAAEDAAGALEAILGMAGPLKDRIASVFEFQGAEKAVAEADNIRGSLSNLFEEAGLSTEQVWELLDAMGLLPEDIDMAIKLSGADVAMAQIQVIKDMVGTGLDGDENAGIRGHISMLMMEEDFTAARDMIYAFQQDMIDGSLDNPILLTINGDTTMADQAVRDFQVGVETAEMLAGIFANTDLADGEVQAWRFGVASTQTDAPIGANTDPAVGTIGNVLGNLPVYNARIDAEIRLTNRREIEAQLGGSLAGDQRGLQRRAMGGPVAAGEPYWVGDKFGVDSPSAELFVPSQDGTILTREQLPHIPVPVGIDGGGSSVPTSMAEVGALAAEVRTLAKQVAMKGDTNNFYGSDAGEVTAEQASRKRARVWSAGLA